MSLKELISIDSYGWIERFTNGAKALEYNKIIESCEPKEIVTSIVVLFEVVRVHTKALVSSILNLIIRDSSIRHRLSSTRFPI